MAIPSSSFDLMVIPGNTWSPSCFTRQVPSVPISHSVLPLLSLVLLASMTFANATGSCRTPKEFQSLLSTTKSNAMITPTLNNVCNPHHALIDFRLAPVDAMVDGCSFENDSWFVVIRSFESRQIRTLNRTKYYIWVLVDR